MANNPVKILAIDDNCDNLVIIRAMIGEIMPDAAVLTALNGPTALAVAEREQPDVILLDIVMPVMDGFEVCRRFKASETLAETPVVFVTAAREDQRNRIRALECGAEAFLAKPIDASELTVLLRAMLKIRQANREKRDERARLARLVDDQTRELRQSYAKTIELLEDLRKESQVRRESEMRAMALVARLQEADANKNRFISMLSHELRNPLAAITLSLSMARQTGFDPDRSQKAWEIICRQTNQLTRIVDDLLDVTRINENKINIRKERIELGDIIGRVLADHQAQLQAKAIELDLSLPSRPCHLDADPVRISQVLGNLLHNSLKFTQPQGKIRVSLRRCCDGKAVTIQIGDTGAGIEPELLQTVFEPFTQADRSLARSQGGLGLGLAIVKGIVERHGGYVHVASDGPGKGTEFTITLPLNPSADTDCPDDADEAADAESA